MKTVTEQLRTVITARAAAVSDDNLVLVLLLIGALPGDMT